MTSSAASPLSAISTTCPSASRLKRSPDAMCDSSSTTSSDGIDFSDPQLWCSRQLDAEGRTPADAFALGVRPAAVAPRGGSDNEESETGTFDALRQWTGNPVEAPKDALGLDGRQSRTVIAHAQ